MTDNAKEPRTINDLPEHERRGYDRYQQELAHVEYVMAEERRAVFGEIPADRRLLTEQELCKTWPEWLDSIWICDCYQSGDLRHADDCPMSSVYRKKHARDIDSPEAESEQKHRAWEEECDQLYAAEELERLAAEQQEVRDDR